jgi:prophage regulatory protein
MLRIFSTGKHSMHDKKIPSIERILIGTREVMQMLGVGRTTLHRLRQTDPTFPKPIKDGPHRQAHAYFVKSEIEAWVKFKADTRTRLGPKEI